MKAFVGGAVYTMEQDAPMDAIAIDRGAIVCVGTKAEVLGRAGAGAEVVDASGKAIFPGFIDPHHHMSMGVFYDGCVPCGPASCPSLDALLLQLRRACEGLGPDAWIMAQGYDDLQLVERRPPTRWELDDACGGRPVLLLHYSCHEGIASTRALEIAGFLEEQPDPAGGVIVRDLRGRATGRVLERAMTLIETRARADVLARSEDEWIARIPPYEARLFAAGITRIGDALVTPDFDRLFVRAREEGKLTIPLLRLPGSGLDYLTPPRDRFGQLRTGDGPEDFRVGPMKLVLDGGMRCAMCMNIRQFLLTTGRSFQKMLRDRSLTPLMLARDVGLRFGIDFKARSGMLFYEGGAAEAMVREARGAGFGVAIHANGNAAVAQAIAAIDAAKPTIGGYAPRIEHATFVEPESLRRLADLGATIVTQPPFLDVPQIAEAPLPVGMTVLPFRSLLSAGVVVAGSSDAPVTDFDVLRAIRIAARRTIHPEEAITPLDAFALYTRNAAKACHALDVTGTLSAGKRADVVILSNDPIAGNLDGVTVSETILAGKTVYRASVTA